MSQRTVSASASIFKHAKPKEVEIWLEESTPNTLLNLLKSVRLWVQDKLTLKLKHSVETRTPCDEAILELHGARY